MGSFINSSVLRLLDANFNRAREALRVLEDYVRFIRNDAALSEELKVLRHDLKAAVSEYVNEAIGHRDTPGDVGTTIATAGEAQRAGLTDVVIAAGKRLGEALRSIEEYLKTVDANAAGQVEGIRYRFYATEQKVVLTLPLSAACGFADVKLYVLITEAQCKIPWLDAAREAIAGGADCLQLREKDLESGELLHRAKAFVALCKSHDVISIINDRPDIAALTDADGVHVGQGDLPITEVRKLLGRDKIVGVSTHNIEQALTAERAGANYIGVGPIFPSKTKPRDFLPGLGFARAAAKEVGIPTVAIAGITLANLDEVVATGGQAIAVTAAVVGASDVRAAAKAFKERLAFSAVARTFLSVSPPALPPSPPPVGQAFLPVSPPIPNEAAAQPTIQDKPNPLPTGVSYTRRHLPHWDVGVASYFLTFRVQKGELKPAERQVVFDHILRGHNRFYTLFAGVVMPDHAHMLIQPMNGYSVARIAKGTKGVSAQLVNELRGTVGQLWQDETFDRVVRDREEFEGKLRYVTMNPVKRELVKEPSEYPYLYVITN